MAGLPPKPGDTLPPAPYPVRLGMSRAASMRVEAPQRDWERDERQRRSPTRQDGRGHPPRNDDRRQEQHSRKPRDWEDRESDRPRPRPHRDRMMIMDTYIPSSHSSQPHRRPASRSRSPRSRDHPPRSHHHRPRRWSRSPYRHSRSRSPRHRRPSPYSRRYSSRERRRYRSPRRRQQRIDAYRSSRSKSRGPSETHDERFSRSNRHGKSRSRTPQSALEEDIAWTTHETFTSIPDEKPVNDDQPSLLQKADHPPSGPRRPRTPTGPRPRSLASSDHHSIDDETNRQDKGKAREIMLGGELDTHNRRASNHSRSPSLDPHKHKRHYRSLSRHSASRSRSQSQSHFRSRSCSSSSSSRLRSRSRSRSRSLTRSMHSPSPRSLSPSPSLSRSHRTRSERLSPRIPTGPRADRSTMHREQNGRKMPNIDDLIPPAKPRPSRTLELEVQIKNVQEQRVKLEKEHVNVMRAVRRAQHELDLAMMEQRSAEERRKAAERVHERVVKGFVEPVT